MESNNLSAVPQEYQDDPDLYWAIQASLNENVGGGSSNPDRPTAPESGKPGAIDIDDPLDIMIQQKQREEEAMLNDSMNNFQMTKTPSTAEHGSIKGHVSFESHANNLNAFVQPHDVSNFDQSGEKPKELTLDQKRAQLMEKKRSDMQFKYTQARQKAL